MALVPRVRPRVALEDRVDREVHPPRAVISTEGEDGTTTQAIHWSTKLALVLLAVFWVALPVAGLLGPLLGLWAGLALLGLAASSLTASILLGAE